MDEELERLFADFVWGGKRIAERPEFHCKFVPNAALDIRDALGKDNALAAARRPTDAAMLPIHLECLSGQLGILAVYSTHTFSVADQRSADLLSLLVLRYQVSTRRSRSDLPDISRRVARYFKRIRQELGLTPKTLATRLGASPDGPFPDGIVRFESAGEMGSELLPTWADVVAYATALGILAQANVPIVTIVDRISPELLNALREDPVKMGNLTDEQFELLIANRLDRMGFEVKLTGPVYRKDGGVDLIAVPRAAGAGTYLLAGQCKRHGRGQKTGVDAVDRLLSLRNGVFNMGLLVTNTEFTADARWKATQGSNQAFAKLRGFEDLRRWLQDSFQDAAEFSELPDEIELAPGVRIVVPKPRGVHAPNLVGIPIALQFGIDDDQDDEDEDGEGEA